ncbi:YheU family protein [Shewanella sp. Isolate8]|uniref:YheU family protein n=1 Tax=Shewanella sp. Isolate8 TaxID=2908529 RepID=UPI001EFC5A0C|nr:YheU family protein [Shewanella sp. Isolate8]MCG9747797.1 YheU family protein [Shewanella sp. Isolate8]
MLVPYQSLLQLPSETLDNLIKEFLFTQTEDGSFASLDDQALARAIAQCRQALARSELVVEYSEEEESIAIRQRQDTLTQQGRDDEPC